ncbi:NAD(P)-dependent dehydrogenase, short-chain alcohol dehydrogenase family [Enhydrobacter aerosaccus]|uniref:NAD(P)-dependent dehydrogenase, short-chain alcohol dehydrogenase family n=1 Tax=Enhydrobacter aerosaccus TaxID=225324 RepID=A0A1T4MUM5_9HYPH|nr:SDR family oxidoreductase [Enhydrobacter aerosaccus]SJZ70544.1 NAD(P)-dependent dehydrogenase, short-chain alcohol dehydrogenase family [Enhydrobacter aerosaccus]
MKKLAGKVAIVTGGASGMGRATVMRFLADGAKVVVADLNEQNGAETISVARAQGHGDSVAFIRTDVAREADVVAMAAEAEKRFGRLDIAYLNAGVGGAFGPIAETSVEGWDYTFAVLTRSVFLGMKHTSLAMKKHGQGGVILVTASIAGMVGGGGSHAYSAAKAAVISLIENVAAELGPDRIRVVGIAPGVISTPLVHRGKPERYEKQFKQQPWPDRGEPEDIADVAAFLCSSDARFITGETVKVDGGLLAQGVALWGTGADNTFMKSAGVNRGTTGETMVVRTLQSGERK